MIPHEIVSTGHLLASPPGAEEARQIALTYLQRHHARVVFATLFGSTAMGRATPESDIDVLVVRDDIPGIIVDHKIVDGRRVQGSIISPKALLLALSIAKKKGDAFWVCALRGVPVAGHLESIQLFQKEAAKLLPFNSVPLRDGEGAMYRAKIASGCIKLGQREDDSHRLVAASIKLLELVQEFALRHAGWWPVKGIAAENLKEANRPVYDRLYGAFSLAVGASDFVSFRDVVIDIMADYGGVRWETQHPLPSSGQCLQR